MADLRDLIISPSRTIPAHLLSAKFSRSGGPGGQNVNKVSSKVDLRLCLAACVDIWGESNHTRILEKLSNRFDAEGNLQIISSEHRTQSQNMEAALARMEAVIKGALQKPKPRRKTKPTKASKERRLSNKKHRSKIKKQRSERPE